MTVHLAGPTCALDDQQALLLWQTCAHADAVTATVPDGDRDTAQEAMVAFLRARLLPHLRDEERQLPRDGIRDQHLLRMVLADHDRLRADVANVEGIRTRRLLVLAVGALVQHLDRHIRREQSWMVCSGGR